MRKLFEEPSYFDQLTAEASKIVKLSSAYSEPNPLGDVLCEFSGLFSGKLGNIKGAEYEIELLDQVPVRSPPYHCAPPKLKLLKEFVHDLLTFLFSSKILHTLTVIMTQYAGVSTIVTRKCIIYFLHAYYMK